MLISITDSNHGYFTPEEEECARLSEELKTEIEVKYQNCNDENVIAKCQGSDVLLVSHLEINKRIVDQIPRCKIVTRMGVGLDNLAVSELVDSGIRVINFPEYCTEEVANHATAMILSSYKRLGLTQRVQATLAEEWGGKGTLLKGIRKAGLTTIGILGLGRIGTCTAKRLIACGFKVIACDPFVEDSHFDSLRIERHSCNSLFQNSDIVSIHCCLDDVTLGMVNADLLGQMKVGASLVNTARGKIVNSDDLKDALKSGSLQSAYVDVFDPEPPDQDSLCFPNLYITPHTSFYSWDSQDWIKRESIRESVRVFYDMQGDTINCS